MNRILLLTLMVLLSAVSVSAQNPNLERLNAYKIGFFTRRLSLTPSEAEKFWPVYNEYQEEKIKIQAERFALFRNFNQNGSAMNDEQLIRLSDRLVESQVKETELSVTFHSMLKQVLPPFKVVRYYQAENQYKVQLLNELQNKPQNKAQQGDRLENFE